MPQYADIIFTSASSPHRHSTLEMVSITHQKREKKLQIIYLYMCPDRYTTCVGDRARSHGSGFAVRVFIVHCRWRTKGGCILICITMKSQLYNTLYRDVVINYNICITVH